MKQNEVGTPRKWYVVMFSWIVVGIVAAIAAIALTTMGTIIVMAAYFTVAHIFSLTVTEPLRVAVVVQIGMFVLIMVQFILRQRSNAKRGALLMEQLRAKAESEPQSAAPVQEQGQ